MTQSIRKSQIADSVSSIIVPNRHLYKRIANVSSLAKFTILAGICVFFYFLVYYLQVYFIYSRYFPIILIIAIFTGFGLWVTSAFAMFSITGTMVEKKLIRRIFPLLLILGILTAYLAMVIENKFLSLVTLIVNSPLFFGVESNLVYTQLINVIFYVYVVPILEEFAKIFPVLVLMGNFVKLSSKDRNIVTSLTPSHRSIVLFGAFFGAWFDLFEQLLSYSITSDAIVLITNRSVYPLHSVTTMITAFGLGWIFVHRKRMHKIVKIIFFIISLTLSSVFHGLWNSNFWIVESPVNLQILGYVSYGLFAFFLLWILLKVPKLCPKCYSEHSSVQCDVLETSFYELNTKFLKNKDIKEIYDETAELMRCSECQVIAYNGEFCLNCWSFPKLQCENCNQVIPAFSRNCWACGVEVPSLIDKMSSSSPPIYVNIAVGITRIIGMGLFVISIFVFVNASNSLDFLGEVIFILGVILSISVAVFWQKQQSNRVKSTIVSLNVSAIMALIVIIMVIYMAVVAVLFLVTVVQIILGILSLLILISVAIGCAIFLAKIIGGTNLIVI